MKFDVLGVSGRHLEASGRHLEAARRHPEASGRHLEAPGRQESWPGASQAEEPCPKEGIELIPGGSRKPRRKVTTLLPAGYKATNLEAIRLIGPNL